MSTGRLSTFDHSEQDLPGSVQDESAVIASSPSGSGDNSEAEESDGGEERDSKKRKRTQGISCELCKTRKVKCDRAEPKCGWCARNNRECVYKERRKPGIRIGYGRELEDKIKRLDAMLQVLGRRVEDHIQDHDRRDALLSRGLQRINYQSPESTYSTRDLASLPYLNGVQKSSVVDSPWPQTTSEEGTHYSRQPETMSIQTVVGTSANERGDLLKRSTSASHGGNESVPMLSRPRSSTMATNTAALPPSVESELPPHDLLYSIVDLYFKHVNPWIPILDRKATFDNLFGTSPLTEPDRVLLHSIVATTLRFSKDPRLTDQTRQQYHDLSKQKVQLFALENPNVQGLQALVILGIDLMGSYNRPQAWNLFTVIVQNVVRLGLCTEKKAFVGLPENYSFASLQSLVIPQPKSWIEDEERRRLVWVVYGMDRYASVGASSEFLLNDLEMSRQLPCRYDLFSRNEAVETKCFQSPESAEAYVNRPENLGSFSYHCEVLRTLSRIHKFLKKPLNIVSSVEVQQWRESYRELDGELNRWLHHLPGEYGQISQLCHSDPGSRVSNWIMIHAAFVTSVIRLHSVAAYPTVRSHIFTPSFSAVQRCLAAVESLRDIAQDVVTNNMLDLLGPPFAFALWVSARLLMVDAATKDTELDPKIIFFMSTLEQMGNHWDIARLYAAVLSRVMQDYGTPDRPYNGSQRSIRTYGTMRRSAYDLTTFLNGKPHSVLEEFRTTEPTANELDYLEVFDFFNYPRIPPKDAGVNGNIISDSKGSDMQSSTQIHDFRTTDFSMPSRDADWLMFKAPYD